MPVPTQSIDSERVGWIKGPHKGIEQSAEEVLLMYGKESDSNNYGGKSVCIRLTKKKAYLKSSKSSVNPQEKEKKTKHSKAVKANAIKPKTLESPVAKPALFKFNSIPKKPRENNKGKKQKQKEIILTDTTNDKYIIDEARKLMRNKIYFKQRQKQIPFQDSCLYVGVRPVDLCIVDFKTFLKDFRDYGINLPIEEVRQQYSEDCARREDLLRQVIVEEKKEKKEKSEKAKQKTKIEGDFSKDYERALLKEKKHLEKMSRSLKKVTDVLTLENELYLKNQKKFDLEIKRQKMQEQSLYDKRVSAKLALHEKAMKEKKARQTRKKMQERREMEYKKKHARNIREREKKLDRFLSKKKALVIQAGSMGRPRTNRMKTKKRFVDVSKLENNPALQHKRRIKMGREEAETKRKLAYKRNKKEAEKTRIKLLFSIEAREKRALQLREEARLEADRAKVKRLLIRKKRMMEVQRARIQKEFKIRQQKIKLDAQIEKMNKVKKLNEKMQAQRKVTVYQQQQKIIAWKAQNKAKDRNPGPGQYSTVSDFTKYKLEFESRDRLRKQKCYNQKQSSKSAKKRSQTPSSSGESKVRSGKRSLTSNQNNTPFVPSKNVIRGSQRNHSKSIEEIKNKFLAKDARMKILNKERQLRLKKQRIQREERNRIAQNRRQVVMRQNKIHSQKVVEKVLKKQEKVLLMSEMHYNQEKMRRERERKAIIERHAALKKKEEQLNNSPGPGHYTLPDQATQVTGGTWATYSAPTSLDIVISRAKETPSSVQYADKDKNYFASLSGGKFSTAYPLSDVDKLIIRAKNTPAPCEYDCDKNVYANMPGQKFSTSSPLSDVDTLIARAKTQPGPGQYGNPGSDFDVRGSPYVVNNERRTAKIMKARAKKEFKQLVV